MALGGALVPEGTPGPLVVVVALDVEAKKISDSLVYSFVAWDLRIKLV